MEILFDRIGGETAIDRSVVLFYKEDWSVRWPLLLEQRTQSK